MSKPNDLLLQSLRALSQDMAKLEFLSEEDVQCRLFYHLNRLESWSPSNDIRWFANVRLSELQDLQQSLQRFDIAYGSYGNGFVKTHLAGELKAYLTDERLDKRNAKGKYKRELSERDIPKLLALNNQDTRTFMILLAEPEKEEVLIDLCMDWFLHTPPSTLFVVVEGEVFVFGPAAA